MPSADSPVQLIFTETLDGAALRFLKQAARHFSRVHCHTPATVRARHQRQLPGHVEFFKLADAAGSSEAGGLPMQHLAEMITDRMMATVKQWQPDFFAHPAAGYDYENILRFCLNFDIARQRLNYLHACLAVLTQPAYAQADVVFLNSIFGFEQAREVLRQLSPAFESPRIRFRHAPVHRATHWQRAFRLRLFQAKYQFRRRFSKDGHRHETPNGILTFMRAPHHMELLSHSLKRLSPDVPVLCLDLLKKNYKQEDPHFSAHLLSRLGLSAQVTLRDPGPSCLPRRILASM